MRFHWYLNLNFFSVARYFADSDESLLEFRQYGAEFSSFSGTCIFCHVMLYITNFFIRCL